MRFTDCIFLGMAAFGAFGMHCLTAGQSAPDPSWTTEAKVLRVIDGDTIEVAITRTFRVRMLDCWAPESRRDPRLGESERAAEKTKGQAAKENLISLANGREVIVSVPLSAKGDVAQVWTMGRVLGHVWLADDREESLSEKQVRAGFAEVVKPERLR